MDLKYLLFIGSALGFSLALGVCIVILACSKPYPLIKRSKKEKHFFDPTTEQSLAFPAISDKFSVNLSVIVPAYNEELRLGPMLDECLDFLETRRKNGRFSYEVIVVSDGSSDETVSKALSYSRKYSSERVRVLALEANRGKGGAVRLGMMSARGSLLLFADADGATKFADLTKLEDSLKELLDSDYLSSPEISADQLAITVGSRAHLEDEAVATRTVFRTILMYGFHFLVWLFAVRGIRDTQCGFKLLTRKAAALCFDSMHVERWAFDVELLYIAKKLKIPISEVAVNWTEIEGSKVTPVWSWLQMGLDLGLIWLSLALLTAVLGRKPQQRCQYIAILKYLQNIGFGSDYIILDGQWNIRRIMHFNSDGDLGTRVIELAYMLKNPQSVDKLLQEYFEDDSKKYLDIEKVILHHNELNVIPNNLTRFSNMKVLDLSSNGLTVLPDLFRYCRLTKLVVKNNRLDNEALPKEFSDCATLKELNLAGNNIAEFPEQILALSGLKYLYLGGNGMKNIPKEIWKLKHLQVLSLGGNNISEVPVSVGLLTNLHALVLCDNQIESLPASVANLHNLRSLLIHKNRLKTLPPEIIALRNLSELSLRDNPLVVRFVSDIQHQPASLLELSARAIKLYDISTPVQELPQSLVQYLESAHRCVNPDCKGVYFDNRVEHIKFVDFCGKYRIPLLQYLCSPKCASSPNAEIIKPHRTYLMKKVLLG